MVRNKRYGSFSRFPDFIILFIVKLEANIVQPKLTKAM